MISEVDNQRLLMVKQQIEPWGVNCPRIIEAFKTVPRDFYVPDELKYQAYHDKSIEVMGIEMLPPKTLAKMLQCLDVQPSDVLLVVGIGLGYSYAIADQLTRCAIGVEIESEVFDQAQHNLQLQAISIERLYHADAQQGFVDLAPFDKILFTGAFDLFPSERLFQQLSLGGKCFFFSQADQVQHGYLIERTSRGYEQSLCFETYVPFLKNIPREKTFVL